MGFQSEFSTINLPEGVYELYIYVLENEETYGIVNTGKKYIKDQNGFHMYNKYGEEVNLPIDTFEINDIVFRLDNFSINSNRQVCVNGWGFLNDITCSDTNVYMILNSPHRKNIIIELEKELRTDVSSVYGEQYSMCGFKGILNPDILLEDGVYLMSYIIEKDGRYYISSEVEQLIITDGINVERCHIES